MSPSVSIERCAGSQFDPDIAGEFNTGIETFRDEKRERGDPVPEGFRILRVVEQDRVPEVAQLPAGRGVDARLLHQEPPGLDLVRGRRTLRGTVERAGAWVLLRTDDGRWALLGRRAAVLTTGESATVMGIDATPPADCPVRQALTVYSVN